MASAPTAFTVATAPEPHRVRTRQLIKAHPEVKQLMTRNPTTFLIGLGCVAAQVALAYFLRNQAWYWTLPVAYLVGAFFSHTLFVVIHEAAHNLVFRKLWQNVATGILANFPSVFPTAISFKNFHIKHHVFQGVHELDADLPDWYEAKLIHNYSIGKAIWLFFFPLFQVIRTARCREVATVDRYVAANIIAQIAFDVAIVYFLGWTALLYLFLSFWFSVGPAPARGPLDSGALSHPQPRAGNLLLLRPSERHQPERGLPQRAPRPAQHPVEQPAQNQGPGARVLRAAAGPPQLHQAVFPFPVRPGNQPLLAHHAPRARHGHPQGYERAG